MANVSGTKFVVLTSQRSGSTWVIDILNKLENTTVYGELFLPRKRIWDVGSTDYPRFIEAKLEGLTIRPFSVFSYLKELYRRPGTVGFKLMYSQLQTYPEILAYLCTHHIRVVHLIRWNHLDVVISSRVAKKIKQAHVLRGQRRPNAFKIQLDAASLIGEIKRLRRNIKIAQQLLRWCRLPHLEIAYEDLLRDQSLFRLIVNFLSINHEGPMPQSELVKIRRGGYSDVIANYEEIKEVLSNSPFAELIQ